MRTLEVRDQNLRVIGTLTLPAPVPYGERPRRYYRFMLREDAVKRCPLNFTEPVCRTVRTIDLAVIAIGDGTGFVSYAFQVTDEQIPDLRKVFGFRPLGPR